jgi:hypothetical protein
MPLVVTEWTGRRTDAKHILKLNLTLGQPAGSSIATILGEAIMKSSLRQKATPQHRSRPRGNDRPHPKTPWAGQHPRRRFLGLAAGVAALPALSRFARAQAYPTRPVRIVVGYVAGGPTDIVARLIGQWLSERLGQQFVAENRPGAANTYRHRGGRARAPGWLHTPIGHHSGNR